MFNRLIALLVIVFAGIGVITVVDYGIWLLKKPIPPPQFQPGKFHRIADVRTFKLHEAIAEESIVCFTKQAAVDVVDAGAGGQAVLMAHFRKGTCVQIAAMIVYSRSVHRNGKVRVYEGKVGIITIFAPTDYVAESETDI